MNWPEIQEVAIRWRDQLLPYRLVIGLLFLPVLAFMTWLAVASGRREEREDRERERRAKAAAYQRKLDERAAWLAKRRPR